MTTLAATDLNIKNIHQSSFGNAVIYEGKVTLSANPTAADLIRLVRIPGGTRVVRVEILTDDLDAHVSPELAIKGGYTPVNSDDGPTADDDYWWATGATILQSSGRKESTSDPKTFDYDVWVDLYVEVDAATFAAGDVHCIVYGYGIGR